MEQLGNFEKSGWFILIPSNSCEYNWSVKFSNKRPDQDPNARPLGYNEYRPVFDVVMHGSKIAGP